MHLISIDSFSHMVFKTTDSLNMFHPFRQVLLPSLTALRADEERPWTLMQDNAPVHTARAVRQWLTEHEDSVSGIACHYIIAMYKPEARGIIWCKKNNSESRGALNPTLLLYAIRGISI